MNYVGLVVEDEAVGKMEDVSRLVCMFTWAWWMATTCSITVRYS